MSEETLSHTRESTAEDERNMEGFLVNRFPAAIEQAWRTLNDTERQQPEIVLAATIECFRSFLDEDQNEDLFDFLIQTPRLKSVFTSAVTSFIAINTFRISKKHDAEDHEPRPLTLAIPPPAAPNHVTDEPPISIPPWRVFTLASRRDVIRSAELTYAKPEITMGEARETIIPVDDDSLSLQPDPTTAASSKVDPFASTAPLAPASPVLDKAQSVVSPFAATVSVGTDPQASSRHETAALSAPSTPSKNLEKPPLPKLANPLLDPLALAKHRSEGGQMPSQNESSKRKPPSTSVAIPVSRMSRMRRWGADMAEALATAVAGLLPGSISRMTKMHILGAGLAGGLVAAAGIYATAQGSSDLSQNQNESATEVNPNSSNSPAAPTSAATAAPSTTPKDAPVSTINTERKLLINQDAHAYSQFITSMNGAPGIKKAIQEAVEKVQFPIAESADQAITLETTIQLYEAVLKNVDPKAAKLPYFNLLKEQQVPFLKKVREKANFENDSLVQFRPSNSLFKALQAVHKDVAKEPDSLVLDRKTLENSPLFKNTLKNLHSLRKVLLKTADQVVFKGGEPAFQKYTRFIQVAKEVALEERENNPVDGSYTMIKQYDELGFKNPANFLATLLAEKLNWREATVDEQNERQPLIQPKVPNKNEHGQLMDQELPHPNAPHDLSPSKFAFATFNHQGLGGVLPANDVAPALFVSPLFAGAVGVNDNSSVTPLSFSKKIRESRLDQHTSLDERLTRGIAENDRKAEKARILDERMQDALNARLFGKALAVNQKNPPDISNATRHQLAEFISLRMQA